MVTCSSLPKKEKKGYIPVRMNGRRSSRKGINEGNQKERKNQKNSDRTQSGEEREKEREGMIETQRFKGKGQD
jgi:hypothetical protein